MVKNRYRDAFGYHNTIRTDLSKQNKAAKLDNELTPEEEKNYISNEELMSVPGKLVKQLTERTTKYFYLELNLKSWLNQRERNI